MKDLNQLLLNFDYKQNFKDNDFYVSKSNYFAFNIINSWPKWEKNFLNICGDKYSGKSHLINIFLKKFKGIIIDANSFKNNQHGISLNNVGQNRVSSNVFESNLQNAIQIDGGGWHTINHNTISSPWSGSCGDSCYSNEGIRVFADAVNIHSNTISGAKIGINILDSSGVGTCIEPVSSGEEFWLWKNTISVLSSAEVTNGIKHSGSEKICYVENTITGTNGGDPRSFAVNGDKNSIIKI